MSSRLYPAIHVTWSSAPDESEIDALAALLDETSPTAIEERPEGVRFFFGSTDDRDRAAALVAESGQDVTVDALLVSDEAWAERSQAALTAIRAGRVVVAPPWAVPADSLPSDVVVLVQPSMGFGTGHHASTRLCLELLQTLPLTGQTVLDVGTGSGVLAVTAHKLGAARVVAIDVDPDAIDAARDTLERNQAEMVTLAVEDLMHPVVLRRAGEFDVVLANLTGGMLERTAVILARALAPGGVLVASGFQIDEEAAVTRAFADASLAVSQRATDAGWVAVTASPTRSTAR